MKYCVHWFVHGPEALATTKELYKYLPIGVRVKKQYGVWVGVVNEGEWIKVHLADRACPKAWEVRPAPDREG